MLRGMDLVPVLDHMSTDPIINPVGYGLGHFVSVCRSFKHQCGKRSNGQ
jgi:hypothetical protein